MADNKWSLDFSKYAQDVTAKSQAVFRKTAFDMFRGIVLDTPVLSGRARGNWIPSIGQASTANVLTTDESGDLTVAVIADETRRWYPITGDSFFLTNNLPYIERLEDGYSKKAPAGMVARNVSRFGMVADNASRADWRNWDSGGSGE